MDWFWWLFGVAVAAMGSASIWLATRVKSDAGLIKTPEGQLHWPKSALPLMVILHPDLYPWGAVVEQACRFWNSRIGQHVFIYMGEGDVASFSGAKTPGVVPVIPGDVRAHANLFWNEKGEVTAAPITLPSRVIEALKLRVIVHELGHTLGLAHDDELPGSVMYPATLPDEWSVTEKDLALLRQWYG